MFTSCEDDYADYYYEVTGTATHVDITMSNLFGGTIQHNNIETPWTSQTFRNDSPTNSIHAYISAQNRHNTDTTVTVKIYRNGAVVKNTTSSGGFCIATASYTNK